MATLRDCLIDFDWFASQFLRVKPAEGGVLRPFSCKPAQAALNRHIDQHRGKLRKILILKSRRMGISTYVAAKFSHIAWINPHVRAVVAAHTGPDSENLFGIYERFYANCPDYYKGIPIKPMRRGGRGQTMDFREIDSEIDVSSATREPRGGDVQYLHLSEVAYYDDPERYLGALMPSLPLTGDGIVVLESTSDGPAGFYKNQWDRATTGESGYYPFFFSWHEDKTFRLADAIPRDDWDDYELELHERFGVDGHQLAWYRDVLDTQCFGNEKRRRLEYPSTPEEAFTNIEGTVWEAEILLPCYQKAPPIWEGYQDPDGRRRACKGGTLKIWEHPSPQPTGWDYVIGADVGGGLADSDLSVASVWRVPRRGTGWPEQVAELSVNRDMDVITWGEVLSCLGHYYNRALLSAEVTGLGRGTQATLMKREFYPRQHRWVPWDRYKSSSDTWGWETSWKSKQIMIGLADWLLRKGAIVIRSAELMEELMFFRQTAPEQYEGARGDDRIMAAMIAWASWFQHISPGVSMADLRDKLNRIHSPNGREPQPVAKIDGSFFAAQNRSKGRDEGNY